MSEAVSRYIVAVMLHGTAKEELQALRDTHAIPSWEPKVDLHITLVRPFSTTIPPDAIASRLALVASHHLRFPLKLEGLGRFDYEESILFVRVDPAPPLLDLQSELQQTLEGVIGSPDFSFQPHVSISAESSPQEIDDYLLRLADTAIRYLLPCEQFALLRLSSDSGGRQWRLIQTFTLQ